MKKASFLPAGALLVLLLASPGARSASYYWPDAQTAYPSLPPQEAALRFLEENTWLFAAGSTDALAPLPLLKAGDVYHARFAQLHRGIPVKYARVTVTVDGKGRVWQLADGTVDPALLPEPGSCIGADDALREVAGKTPGVKHQKSDGPFYVFLAPEGGARLVRGVRVFTAAPFGLFEAYVDCAGGGVIGARDLLVEAQGKVYDPNPVVNPAVQTVTLPNLPLAARNLEGTLARAWSCSGDYCDSAVHRAEANADGDFLYDPVEPSITDPFAEVNAYYHVDKVNAWFETALGLTTPCGGRRAVDINVNMNYPNAFYGDVNGNGCGDVTLGQDMASGGVDFAYDADVIYHEYTHGVVDATAQLRGFAADELGPDYSSGGLNEGTADYYAVTMTGSPVLGDYAGGSYGGELGIRNAVNDRRCPENLTGETHMDGEIWTGTLWEIRTAIGADDADKLVLAVLNSISSRADFDEGGRALVTQAAALETNGTLEAGEAAQVEAIARARGLVGCVRIILLEDGDTAMTYMFGLREMGGYVDESASGVQFGLVVPEGAVGASVRFTATTYGRAVYDAYVRSNEPIHYRVSGWNMEIDGYDRLVNGSPGSLSWRPWTDPAIVPGTTYYFTFVSRSDWGLLISMEANVIMGEPEPEVEETPEPVAEEPAEADAPVEPAPDGVAADAIADPLPTDSSGDIPADGQNGDVSSTVKLGKACACSFVW